MKNLLKAAAHALFVIGVMALLLLPINKYEWMVDNSTSTGLPTDDSAGGRVIFAALLLLAILCAQAWVAFTARGMLEQALSFVLALVAIGIWLLKFGQIV